MAKRKRATSKTDTRSSSTTTEERSDELNQAVSDVAVLAKEGDPPLRRRKGAGSRSASTTSEERCDDVDQAASHLANEVDQDGVTQFLGEPFPAKEAGNRWPKRYQEGDSELLQAKCHYAQAAVDGCIYSLGDDAFVKAGDGEDDFICKIIEFFEAVDGSLNFTAQWYYRANDTVIKTCGYLIDKKQVFLSEIKDDNPIDCLVKKLKIEFIPIKDANDLTQNVELPCDFYYNKMYKLPYTSFVNMPDDATNGSDSAATKSSQAQEFDSEKTLLDLYSGCGAMSTGLCLGANVGGVRLVTKWAVDFNEYACKSLELNHPETKVRHEAAEDFLRLLIEWEKLCASFGLLTNSAAISEHNEVESKLFDDKEDEEEEEEEEEDEKGMEDEEIFEVEEFLDVCYGDANKNGKPGLHFKIRWKGYGPEEDTWEPQEGLSDCVDKLKDFVLKGYNLEILPLPGSVDVICGGPPCQGMSGFNRFRNKTAPLDDPKNQQLVVYYDIVNHLKPKHVLMENVVDIVKFAGGFLGRYAFGRLVSSGYQVRMGMMSAGAYGLPQFRMRVFMWGALPSEKLPQYPLPTHDLVNRGVIPTEFEMNIVAYDEGREANLKQKLLLGDAISDLPKVENDEERDEMPYDSEPKTEFQQFIRLWRDEMPGCSVFNSESLKHCLYDHRPLCLNRDDHERVCNVPKKKGANFRDFPGVKVNENNKVEWDPNVERVKLSSGRPLVPDYAMSFVGGTSSKPFGRLWWDETVATVVTRAEPHNHALIHPTQDRVLTIRENARLQGFPDYYKLIGPIKQRYMQVGNAVAVPAARALGYSLAWAMRGMAGDDPLLELPKDYPFVQSVPPAVSTSPPAA